MDSQMIKKEGLSNIILQIFVALASIVLVFVMAALIAQLCVYIYTSSLDLLGNLSSPSMTSLGVTVAVFEMIDILLVISFAFMTVLLLYSQYINRLDFVDKKWPWLANMNHQDLKVKIADALVAITSIKLLGLIMAVGTPSFSLTPENILILQYSAGIHIILVVSALIVKIMHKLEATNK